MRRRLVRTARDQGSSRPAAGRPGRADVVTGIPADTDTDTDTGTNSGTGPGTSAHTNAGTDTGLTRVRDTRAGRDLPA
ncbi:hypothetical protein E4K73_40885 [Streptomyces sp. IB201691-2A2]|nr:hypothetical protein E4K73_40885 [Streptomyces sp. IB201691-2A2]